jgi:hypothetical protein
MEKTNTCFRGVDVEEITVERGDVFFQEVSSLGEQLAY